MDRINKSGTSKKASWRKRISAILAGIIVFGTTYYLVLPAITLEGGAAETEPGLVIETQPEKNAGSMEELLDSADIREDALAEATAPSEWAKILSDNGMLITAKGYEPKSGDLVFLYGKTEAAPTAGVTAEAPAPAPEAEPVNNEEVPAVDAETAGSVNAEEAVSAEEAVPEASEESTPPEATEEATDPAEAVTAEAAEETTEAEAPEEVPAEPVIAIIGIVESIDAGSGTFAYSARNEEGEIAQTEIGLDDETIAGFANVPEKTEAPAEPAVNEVPEDPAEPADQDDPAGSDDVILPLKPTGGEVSKTAKGMKDSIFSVSWRGMAAGSMLDVARLNESDSDYSAYVEALRNQVGNVGIYDVLDVNLISGDAADESGITITLSNYEISDKAGTALYHIKDDGSVEELEYSTGLRSVSFTTKSFSPFIFAQRTEKKVDVVKLISPAERALRAVNLKGSTKLRTSSGLMATGNRDSADLEVDKFNVDFSRGATATQNGDTTDYVWNADDPDADHRFTLRVTYSISGSFDYQVEDPDNNVPSGIEILIPMSILVDRDGNPADYFEMSLPHKDEEANLTDDNIFVYEVLENYTATLPDGTTVTGDFIRIINRRDIPVAESGYIEISYLTSKTTYNYADYNPTDDADAVSNDNPKNGSEPFYAIINLNRTDKDTGASSELHQKTREIPVYINTGAEITSTKKDKPAPERQVYDGWNSSWGDRPSTGNPSDYYYIVWEVRTVITDTTQPYNYYLTDTFSPYGEVVKYKLQGKNWSFPVTDGNGTHSEVIRLQEDFTYGRYDYVITRHLKSEYDPILNADSKYTVKNTVVATVDPADRVDDDTTAKSSREWTHYRPGFNPPTGHFYMYKWGYDINNNYTYDEDDIRRYDMTEVTGTNTVTGVSDQSYSIDDLTYYTYVHGYPYPWTLAEGADANVPANYGAETVTWELIDNELYLKWVGDGANNGKGYVRLTADDYKIEKFYIILQNRDVVYNPETYQFEDAPAVTYAANERVYIYAQFDGNTNWVTLGYYDFISDPINALHLDSTYVDTAQSKYNAVVFKSSVNCTGYRLVTANKHYYTLLGAKPSVTLKDSETVREVIKRAYLLENPSDELLNRIEIALKNTAHSNVFDNRSEIYDDSNTSNNRIVTFDRSGVDYVVGFQREGRIDKEYVAYSNDTITRQCVYTWTVDIREAMLGKNGKLEGYVRQTSGIIYDLLPSGATYQPGSVVLIAYDGEPSASNTGRVLSNNSDYRVTYAPSTVDPDRILLTIEIFEAADWYNMTYSSVHTWDSIIAFSGNDDSITQEVDRMAENDVAYKTGNPDIGPESTIDPDKTKDNHPELFAGIEGITSNNTIYASEKHDIGIPLAASIGLHKKVIGNANAEAYRAWTNAGTIYNYVLTFTTDGESEANDLIIYDSLENFVTKEGFVSGWHGTLQSVNIKQAMDLGIDPVVYVYTGSDVLTFPMNEGEVTGTTYDISDTSIWTRVTDDDPSSTYVVTSPLLSQATAVAIDLRYSDESANPKEEFTLGSDKTVRVSLSMLAPEGIEPDENNKINEYAYNNVYLHSKVTSKQNDKESVSNIHQDYTTVVFRVVGAFDLHKVSNSDNETPVQGAYFELKSTELGYCETPHTNSSGYIFFTDLLPGTYTLKEVSGPDSYVVDKTEMTIIVDNYGNVHIVSKDGSIVDDAAAYENVYIVETSTDASGTGVVSITIVNEPRKSGKLEFYKVGTVDGETTIRPLEGVQFYFHGKSDYGKTYNEYLESGPDGCVRLENIDMGSYKLEETHTVDGYILSKIEYDVVVDSDGITTITYTESGVVHVVEQNPDNGQYQIVNEPLHGLKLLKIDAIDKKALNGAEFTLTGIKPETPPVVAVSGDNEDGIAGLVLFGELTPGIYKLEETKAPAHHELNDTVYTVTVSSDGSITITYKKTDENGIESIVPLTQEEIGGIFKIADPRLLESQLTIVKYWPDGNDGSVPVVNVSTEEPVAKGHHATIEFYGQHNTSSRWNHVAFYSGGTNDLKFLNTATSFARNTSAVMQKEDGEKPETVKDQNNNTWYRVDTDDDTTDCTVYLRLNGNTLEWWSDAAVVYFPESCTDMFYSCAINGSLDLSAFDTSKVVEMNYMFAYSANLTTVDMTGWDSSSVKRADYMFYHCSNLLNLDMSHMDFSIEPYSITIKGVTYSVRQPSLGYMFTSCTKLQTLKTGRWDVGFSTDSMFRYCHALTDIQGEENWDLSDNTDMWEMFCQCYNLESLDVSNWQTGNVTTMLQAFRECNSIEELDVSNWDTHSLVYMQGILMFPHTEDSSITTFDMSNWDMSNVEDVHYAFHNCDDLTSIGDVSNWNTSKIKDFSFFFNWCHSLTGLDVHKWDTSSAETMENMFTGVPQTSFDFANWDTSNVKNMEQMFNGCKGLTQLDLSMFNTSKVENMDYMFQGCESLVYVYVDSSRWSTAAVTTSYNMFYYCTAIKGQNNTTYSSSHLTASYAHVDVAGSPGYFWYRQYTPYVEPTPDPSPAPDDGNSFGGNVAPASISNPAQTGRLQANNSALSGAVQRTAESLRAEDDDNSNQYIVYTPEPGTPEAEAADSITVTFITKKDKWEQHGDDPWYYYFDVYSGDATYYIWEDPLPGYKCDHDAEHPIKVVVHYNEETEKLEISECDPAAALVDLGNGNYALKITNTKEDTKAGLKVTKTVCINGVPVESDSELFDFTVTIFDPEDPTKPYDQIRGEYGAMTFYAGVATFQLAHGQSKVAYKLPNGLRFEVKETLRDAQTGIEVTYIYNGTTSEDWESVTGTLDINQVAEVEVRNNKRVIEPKPGDMSIKKFVTFEEGDAPTVAKTFTFTVTLSGQYTLDGTTYYDANTINDLHGDAYFENGVATVSITLTPAQMTGDEPAPTIEITGLPSGITYTVTEPEEDIPYGYSHSAQDITITNGSGIIQPRAAEGEESTTQFVTVTNTKVKIPVGGFKIIKKVEGTYHNETFTVRVAFSGLETGATYYYTINGESNDEWKIETGSGNSANLTLTVKDGDVIEFSGLPVGSTYVVSEDASGYIASYVIMDGSVDENGKLIEVETDSNTFADESISTDTQIVAADNDVIVTITNTSKKFEVKLSKVALDGMYVEGAHLAVIDSQGNTVCDWISGSGAFTTQLYEGAYTLTELEVPNGYLKADDVHFRVGSDGTVYLIEQDGGATVENEVSIVSLIDKPIRVLVLKVDGLSQPLAGARLQILEIDGTAILTWDSTGEAEVIEASDRMKTNTPYILHEAHAPNGYDYADDIPFIIDTDGKVYLITLNEDGTYVLGEECPALLITMVDPDSYELPHAGGPGTRVYTLCGLTIMLAAAIYGFGKRRKRERGSG